MSECATDGARTRVLVVDDSAFMRIALARMINCEPDLEVVASASCGSCALEKINVLDPDVVTLDIAMPGLDGLTTLRCIMKEFPRPVIIVSASTRKDADITLAALTAGAFDYVPKQLDPASLDITHIKSDLVARIRAAAQARRNHSPLVHSRKTPKTERIKDHRFVPVIAREIVAIGVSTGGPKALEQILPRFPVDLPVPIVIVQHMPVGFTGPFAERLDALCSIGVLEAAQGELIQSGVAYIAPAGTHMRVSRRASDAQLIVSLDSQARDALHIPSIDVLMKSVAELFHSRAMGVIMTGMGSDGAEGISAVFHEGGLTIGQDEATCAVYGMPRACSELGVLSRMVPLLDIPKQIIQETRRRQPA
jgi:two-component system, chemotaxis family, protein-glutamate methylesterase/glutaminase